MTTIDGATVPPARIGLCEFPGVDCPNPKQPADSGSGRPPKYCGQQGPGPEPDQWLVHNRANAWNVRNEQAKKAGRPAGRRRPSSDVEQQPASGPLTTARITMDE